MKPFIKERILPLSLTAVVILIDQISKAIIASNWPITPGTSFYSGIDPVTQRVSHVIADIFGNGFIEIIHVRNKAIAFSLGENLPEFFKPVIFIIIPVLVLGFLVWYFFRTNEFTLLQRWAAAGIIGGGLGNMIDRVFRPDGVVDFVSVNVYNLFGMSRWPTFNFADSSVVVCCILLLVTMFISLKKPKSEKAENKNTVKEISNEQKN